MSTPSVDYGSRHKFFASVGLFFIVSSALPLVGTVQKIEILLLPAENIAKLTPSAQDSVTKQQSFAESYLNNAIGMSVGIFIVGLLLFLYGLNRWGTRQSVADQIEDNQLNASFAPQTDAEKKVEAALKIDDIAIASERPNERPGVEIESEPESDDLPPTSSNDRSYQPATNGLAALRNYAEVETQVSKVLLRAFGSTHVVENNIRVDAQKGGRRYLDALATSRREGLPSYIFEIKLISAHAGIGSLRRTVLMVAEEIKFLESATGRKHVGVIFLVVQSDEGYSPERVERFNARIRAMGDDPVISIALREDELHSLSPLVVRDLIEVQVAQLPSSEAARAAWFSR